MPEMESTHLITPGSTFVPISLMWDSDPSQSGGQDGEWRRDMVAAVARVGRDARRRVPSASELSFGLCQCLYLVRLRKFFALDVDCSHLLFTVDVQVSSPPYMFLFLSINNVIS